MIVKFPNFDGYTFCFFFFFWLLFSSCFFEWDKCTLLQMNESRICFQVIKFFKGKWKKGLFSLLFFIQIPFKQVFKDSGLSWNFYLFLPEEALLLEC